MWVHLETREIIKKVSDWYTQDAKTVATFKYEDGSYEIIEQHLVDRLRNEFGTVIDGEHFL